MKIINFQMDDDLHKKMRIKAFCQDKSVRKYVTDLIEADIKDEKEKTESGQA